MVLIRGLFVRLGADMPGMGMEEVEMEMEDDGDMEMEVALELGDATWPPDSAASTRSPAPSGPTRRSSARRPGAEEPLLHPAAGTSTVSMAGEREEIRRRAPRTEVAGGEGQRRQDEEAEAGGGGGRALAPATPLAAAAPLAAGGAAFCVGSVGDRIFLPAPSKYCRRGKLSNAFPFCATLLESV